GRGARPPLPAPARPLRVLQPAPRHQPDQRRGPLLVAAAPRTPPAGGARGAERAGEAGGMRADEYAAMYAVEDDHWWYAGRRRVADALLCDRFPGRRGELQILDAGCGTGGNSAYLRRYGRVTGIDFSAHALGFACERPGLRLARASVETLPFADASFDLVLSNDVLCHLGVASDATAVPAFAPLLRP